jgi:hypothetical protein
MYLLYTFDSNFLFGCYQDKFSPDISFFLCNMSKYEELAVWIPASSLALPSSPPGGGSVLRYLLRSQRA